MDTKKRAKIATTFAAIFVIILVFAPVVPTGVSVQREYVFILGSATAQVSVSFMYFGFGFVYIHSSQWASCSGFYWNYHMASCIVKMT